VLFRSVNSKTLTVSGEGSEIRTDDTKDGCEGD
jgi:hypothetical protein